MWAAIPVAYMASFIFSNSLVANAVTNLAFIFAAVVSACTCIYIILYEHLGTCTDSVYH